MLIFGDFFEIYSITTIEILVLKRQNVEEMGIEHTQKTAGLNLLKKLRYLGTNVFIHGPKSSYLAIFGPFFGLFSKNRIEILVLWSQNVEENGTNQTQKTAAPIFFKKSRYLCPKV
jgi:hypothetical protein